MLATPKSKWYFNQDHHPNLTLGSKKHLNKGKTEVRKALGMHYKLISESGEELNQKIHEVDEQGVSSAFVNRGR